MKKFFSNNKIIVILSILFVIAIISFSYGYWKVQQDGQGKNIDITGTILDISFENENNLNILNAKPIYESEYLTKGNYIDFAVTGKSTILEGCYNLDLDIENISNELKNEYFKWVFYDIDSSSVIASGDFSNINNATITLLEGESLTSETTNNYRIYVYLSYSDSVDQTNMLGTEFEAKIKATASTNACTIEPVLLSSQTNVQEYEVPKTGMYQIELWGASGGYSYENSTNYLGGKGSYTSGIIQLEKGETLYVHTGTEGERCFCKTSKTCCGNNGGYNGGGNSLQYTGGNTYYGSGGGATDVRIDNDSLYDRIMVAGGGGGASNWQGTSSSGYNYIGGASGGLVGVIGTYTRSDRTNTCTGGNQFAAGTGTYNANSAFGVGGIANGRYGPGAGGGYYGGGTAETYSCGGSSFISGHTGCVAVLNPSLNNNTLVVRNDSNGVKCNSSSSSGYNAAGYNTNASCSIHYSNRVFTNTKMIDGAGYVWTNAKGSQDPNGMPNPEGGNYTPGTGHTGDGYARITYLSASNAEISDYVSNGLVLLLDGIENSADGHSNNSTTWIDKSGNNNNGTINGATWTTNGLVFDGTNDWVNLGLQKYTNPTLEVVVKYSNTIQNSEQILSGNYETGGYGLGNYPSYTYHSFTIYAGGYKYASSNVTKENNKMYYLSGSYNNSLIKLYENGTLYTTSSTTALTNNSSTVLAIGTNPAGTSSSGSFFAGTVYSVRLYNRALTDDEVRHNYEIDLLRYGN